MMARVSWREVVLLVAIVALGCGWYWHHRRLSSEQLILSERLAQLEPVLDPPTLPMGPSGQPATTSNAVPDHSGVSPYLLLHFDEK